MARVVDPALGAAILLPLLAACGSTPPPQEREAAQPAATLAALDQGAVLSLACSGCHSPAGGAIASLDGRPAAQIREALIQYRTDTDGTTVMHRMMRGYSEADIDAISAYLAGSETE